MKSNLNKQFVKNKLLVSVLCVLCASVVNSHAQDFKTLKDGIEYAEVTKEIDGQKVNMNLLRLDLTKVRLDVNHAMDSAIGTEKTSSIATRHGAFAAINGGFFRLDTSIWAGDSVGVLMIDGKVLSESQNERTTLMIKNSFDSTSVSIGKVSTQLLLVRGTLGSGTKERIGWPISGINRERKDNELIVFTPEFGHTTLTNPGGLEIALKQGNVASINPLSGSTPIPADGIVVSATGTRVSELRHLHLGDRLLCCYYGPTLPYEDMTNGVPQLIKNGKIDITWEEEKSSKSFVESRHPRTAVAKLKDGKFLIITVDGRSESSGGIGLQDLAEYLLSLGATDAMNLDGGGSTTMFVDGKVVNHPSDKEGERKVGDAILVTPRLKPFKK